MEVLMAATGVTRARAVQVLEAHGGGKLLLATASYRKLLEASATYCKLLIAGACLSLVQLCVILVDFACLIHQLMFACYVCENRFGVGCVSLEAESDSLAHPRVC